MASSLYTGSRATGACAKFLTLPIVLLQTALDKAGEAQKEMESIPEAPTLQDQRAGTGA